MNEQKESRIQKQNFKIMILLYFTIILCIILSNFINVDIIVLFLFISFFLIFVKKNFYTIPKYIQIYVYIILFLIGVFICENSNFYLRELDVYSGYTGSFPLAVLYSIILINSLSFFENKYSKKMYYNPKKIKSKFSVFIANIIYIFVFLMGTLLFLAVLTKPSFKLGVDRFQYEQIYLNRYIKTIASYYKYFLPLTILPIVLRAKKINKEILKVIISILPYILYKVWVGNKFGALFDILILFLPIIIFYIGNYKKNSDSNKKQQMVVYTKKSENKKIFKSLVLTFIVLIAILSTFYITRGKEATSSIIDRLSQQGQLWWKTYDSYKIGEFNINELNDEITPLFNYNNMKNTDYKFGVYKIMQKTTPLNLYKAKIATGARYSAQGIEIAYYYFNIFGLIIHAIIRSFFAVIITNLFIKYFFEGRFVENLIMARILIISNSIFTQGDLFNLTRPSFIIMIMVLIIIKMLYRKK